MKSKRQEYDDSEEDKTDDGLEFDDDSDASDGPEYENDVLFDSDDDDNAATDDEGTEATADHDSGYNSDRTEVTMTEDTDDCFTVEVDGTGRPVRQSGDAEGKSLMSLGRRDESIKHSVTRISASGSSRTRRSVSETSRRCRFTCGTTKG